MFTVTASEGNMKSTDSWATASPNQPRNDKQRKENLGAWNWPAWRCWSDMHYSHNTMPDLQPVAWYNQHVNTLRPWVFWNLTARAQLETATRSHDVKSWTTTNCGNLSSQKDIRNESETLPPTHDFIRRYKCLWEHTFFDSLLNTREIRGPLGVLCKFLGNNQNNEGWHLINWRRQQSIDAFLHPRRYRNPRLQILETTKHGGWNLPPLWGAERIRSLPVYWAAFLLPLHPFHLVPAVHQLSGLSSPLPIRHRFRLLIRKSYGSQESISTLETSTCVNIRYRPQMPLFYVCKIMVNRPAKHFRLEEAVSHDHLQYWEDTNICGVQS